ncbi:Zn finger-containing GTPase- Activating Protein for ARF [Coemansia sp. RSA 2607]|nr:Zn finger-containing GTPase- Activating Protein for ARF [Coemansia sp. RSA 2607]
MDNWTPEQVKRMELGGNAKANAFFRSQPDYKDGMSIKDKYNSRFAELWRQKLTAECEGRPWVAPPAGSSLSPPARSNTSSPGLLSGSHAQRKTFGNNNNNGGSSSAIGSSPAFGNSRSQTPDPARTGSPSTFGGASQNQRNQEYFARLGQENSTRREDLPPSQGGKYSGFGSTPIVPAANRSTSSSSFSAQDVINDPSAVLSKGWSLLATGAQSALSTLGTVAGTINESYVRPAAEKIQDPNFRNDVSSYVSTIGLKVEETANRGFTSLSSYMRSGQQGGGYSQVSTSNSYGNGQNNYNDDDNNDDADFFEKELGNSSVITPPVSSGTPTSQVAGSLNSRAGSQSALQPKSSNSTISARAAPKKTKNWDDDWDNF